MENYVWFSTQDAEQKDHEFKVNLSCIVRTYLKQTNKKEVNADKLGITLFY